MSSYPPTQNATIFNTSFFIDANAPLTNNSGDQRYLHLGGVGTLSLLSVSGNVDLGSLSLSGLAIDPTPIVGVSPGTSSASKALVMDSSNRIGAIGQLGFSSISTTYKTIMRASTISGSTGIEFYDTQLIAPKAVVNFRSDNNSEPVFLEMRGSLNDGSSAPNGSPAHLRWISGQGLSSGINLTVSNTSNAGTGVANNVVLSTRGGSIPHVVCNDQYNQLHLWPQNLSELNTSYAQNVIIGEELLVRKSLCLGTSQDTARMFSCLDSTMVSGNVRYWTFGSAASVNNQAEIAFNQDSTASYLGFGFYGATNVISYSSGGNVAIGTTP
jgi:hypothetical protein